MMPIAVGILILFSALLVLAFSTLTYALRDFSRPKLAEALKHLGRERYLKPTIDRAADLILVTALIRLIGNLLVVIAALHFFRRTMLGEWAQYAATLASAGTISLFCSVIVPHAIAESSGERAIARTIRLLMGLRIALYPLTRITHVVQKIVSRVADESPSDKHEQIDEEIAQEILSVVEEGEKEGVVDRQEKQLIESVIGFTDMTVAGVMTPRASIIAVPKNATLEQMRKVIEECGHSRLPVIDGTLDRITGMLYARDLMKQLGHPSAVFNLDAAMRPVFYVPETKPLSDLLQDFRDQKVHIAVVLDEYGSTAGLVTIEDVLEQLVGEIRDEHEPKGNPMLRRIDGQTVEVDARLRLEDLNRELGTNLLQGAGYETVGGYVTNVLGRIPAVGTSFVNDGLTFSVADAEPQRIKRVTVKTPPRPLDAATQPAGGQNVEAPPRESIPKAVTST
jgi:magnesium and cobalt exporter, CNNM family